MAAVCDQVRTSVIQPYHAIRYKATEPTIPIQLPDLAISFPTVPPSELLERIRSEGGREITVQRAKVFIIPSPKIGFIQNLVAAGANKETPAPVNAVNIKTLASISLIRRIFSNFLVAHTYPAFIDKDHLEYNEEHWKSEKSEKRSREESTSETQAQKKRRGLRSEAIEGVQGESSAMVVDQGETITKDYIIYAVPPSKNVIGWGDADSVPIGDGLFVRYVEDTQLIDGERVVLDVLVRYFMGSLGANADEVKGSYARLKADMGIISRTPLGKVFAHIAKCIDLGLQAQARVFPIFDSDEYVGSALMGSGFAISAYGQVYIPTTSTSLREHIGRAGSGRLSLEAIANVVDEVADNGEACELVRGCESMVELRTALIGANLSQDQRDRIGTLARGLRFRPKNLNVSPVNLIRVLDAIANNVPLDNSYPIHCSMLFETNMAHVYWSSFGDLAPSCRFVGGPNIDLTSSRDLPKHIGFRQVPLREALIDLDLTMSSQAFPGTSANRRSGPFKDRIYQSLDATQILQGLVKLVGGSISNTKLTKSGASGVGVSENIFDDGF